MKLNKKECRKYADPGLIINSNNGLLCAGQIKYIVRSAVKNIAGQRTLALYFYNREKAANGKPSTPVDHTRSKSRAQGNEPEFGYVKKFDSYKITAKIIDLRVLKITYRN